MMTFGVSSSSVAADRRFWIALYMLCPIIPLSLLRSLNALRFTATVSIGFVTFLVGVIVLYSAVPSLDECSGIDPSLPECHGSHSLARVDVSTLKSISVFIFAFTCHQNIFSACNELKDLTVPRINKVIVSSIGIALSAYTLIALCAYHTYGETLAHFTNVLKNYPDNVVLAIARLLIATNCAFTFPLQCNPCRNSISMLMHQWATRHDPAGAAKPHVPSGTRLNVLTACITMGALGIAMGVTDLGIVQGFVGATGSTTISYILPGAIFLKLHKDDEWAAKHYGAAALLAAGCIIIPSCLTFLFLPGANAGH